MGYNIYRDNESYRFQTQRYLANYGINPNCGQDFMFYESGGDGFEIHITAVYGVESTESGYMETQFAQNNLLNVDRYSKQKALIYPNPTTGIINIGNMNLTEIAIFDTSGKKIKAMAPQAQLDLSDISKGIYLMKLVSADAILVEKIVIK